MNQGYKYAMYNEGFATNQCESSAVTHAQKIPGFGSIFSVSFSSVQIHCVKMLLRALVLASIVWISVLSAAESK